MGTLREHHYTFLIMEKYTWQTYKIHENISSEIKINTDVKKIKTYVNKLVKHVRRKDRDRQTDCHT